MNRGFCKFLFSVISLLLLSGMVFALDSEFKNSLLKIELLKTGENSYNVELHTQNKFPQPIKVIKKSDLNYYILLPETKNNASQTAIKGNDIRNITVDLLPYTGQNIKNGYTKININTIKPINFNINLKDNSKKTELNEQKTAQAAAKVPEKVKETIKPEKKNSVFSNENEKEDKPLKKVAQEPENQVKIEDLVQQEVEKAKNQALAEEEIFEEEIEEYQNEPIISNEELKEIERIASSKFQNQFSEFKSKVINKLAQYNLRVMDVGFIFLIILVTFIVILKLLSRKPKKEVKIKAKNELMLDNNKVIQNDMDSERDRHIKNDGQYFVFDKNIKQTGFCAPASSETKRNYELSSYEPDLKNNYKRMDDANQKSNYSNNESEYDIIQKILKSDSFIEIEQDEFKTISKSMPKKQKIQETKTISKPIKEEQVEEIAEPTVLSQIEIAPKRGFMCVSYNDNISLMGYIFDDVFALYNFKQTKLENYEIKYRLTEKDGKNASFIVKVADVKMLVKVTKSSMNMEVLL